MTLTIDHRLAHQTDDWPATRLDRFAAPVTHRFVPGANLHMHVDALPVTQDFAARTMRRLLRTPASRRTIGIADAHATAVAQDFAARTAWLQNDGAAPPIPQDFALWTIGRVFTHATTVAIGFVARTVAGGHTTSVAIDFIARTTACGHATSVATDFIARTTALAVVYPHLIARTAADRNATPVAILLVARTPALAVVHSRPIRRTTDWSATSVAIHLVARARRRHATSVAEFIPIRTTAIAVVAAIQAARTSDRHATIPDIDFAKPAHARRWRALAAQLNEAARAMRIDAVAVAEDGIFRAHRRHETRTANCKCSVRTAVADLLRRRWRGGMRRALLI